MDYPSHADWTRAEDGPRLTVTRRFRHPVERMWAALTTPARIAEWLGVDWLSGDAPLKEGSRFDYRFRNTDMESRGRVLVFEPPSVFEHTWHENIPPPAVVRWALEPRDGGCLLTLTHRAGPPEDGPRTAAGWTMLVESLAASLGEPDAAAGGGMGEWRALRDRFATGFPPEANRDGRRVTSDGNPALRFERRLRHTPEAVWAALTEPAALSRWLQAQAVVDGHSGGRFHLVLGGGSSRSDGRILRWEPPRLLEYTWPEPAANGDSVVRFEIFEAVGGSRLVLTHVLQAGGDILDFGSGWHWHLDALERAIDGETVAFDTPRWTALRQAYAATF